MKDYTVLTEQELFAELEKLEFAKECDFKMDGSGECGHLIEENFRPHFEAIEAELEKRGIDLYDNENGEDFPY